MRHTWFEGARLVFGQFGIVPEWIRGPARATAFTAESPLLYKAPLPILLVVFVLGFIALWRRRKPRLGGDERGWRLAAIVATALVLGVASIARTTGDAYDYRTRWALLLAMTATAVSVWAGWTLVARKLTVRARRAALLLTVVPIAVVVGVNTTDAVGAGTPQSPVSTSMERLGTATLAALPPGGGDVVVDSPDIFTGTISGLVLWLERHGVRARVDQQYRLEMGAHRVHHRGDVRAVLTIATDTNTDDYALRPDQRLVAATTEYRVHDRQRVLARIADVKDAFEEHKLSANEELTRIAKLSDQLGHVTAVFMSTP
jgi:hypothetical protein